MPTFLLAWNPKRWEWHDLPKLAEKVSNGEVLNSRWSCGNSRSIRKGDRVFLIKLGVPPKGIIASGMVVKE
jgi:5-methylcytosine-specific restriction protein A